MTQEQQLKARAAALGVALDDKALHRFAQYAALLLDWNTRMNLTAIREEAGVYVRHFEDSLTLLGALTPAPGARVLDVGTGAGFPGVPLKIVREDLAVTLLDSLQKRLRFLEELLGALGLDAALLHLRAEDGGRDPALREGFDLVTSRAVAELPVLAEYCLPYVRVGGRFAAMKGPGAEEELERARPALAALGGKVEGIHPFVLADGSTRAVIVVEKQAATPAEYPRAAAKIKKSAASKGKTQ
jgi:16S rRNA (guanine527-N7)-methyltransferase